MDGNQLREALRVLALPQALLAKLLGVTPRAVALWLAGERAVPNPVVSYLRIFSRLPENLRQAELAVVSEEDRKMREGMYRITFQSGHDSGDGVLVFEGGQIFGADIETVRYDGEYEFNTGTGLVDIFLKITFPPNVRSVFDITNPYEWSFNISASFDPTPEAGQLALRTSFGAEIVAQYVFLRSLPAAA